MSTVLHSPQRTIGAILMDAGVIDADKAERILKLQKERNMRFGDAAIELGIVTETDIRFALASQFDYVYLPKSADGPVSPELVAAYEPFSHEVDQLRAVRSQLMLRWFDRELRHAVLAVVAADQGQGCSYVAANLAIVFSQLGEKTLLIDGNLRAPRQHELFKIDNKVGFSSVLAGRANSAEAIVPISVFASLSVLPAGPTPPNPQELLNRPGFGELLAYAAETYDIVLIDAPHMAAGADATMVAVRAGAVLAVAKMIETRVSDYRAMVQELKRSGVAVVGSVLNDPPLIKVPE